MRKSYKLDADYLYYYLVSPSINRLLLGIAASGATRKALTKTQIESLEIKLPAFDIQKCLAGILKSIDQKIELNRRMNETLEQMGHGLFKHYFIDNPEAKEWEEGSVSDLVDHKKESIHPGKSPAQEFSHYSIPAFDNSLAPEITIGLNIKSNKYKVFSRSILVSKLNPATPRIWPVITADGLAVSSTEFQALVARKYFCFSYFLLTSSLYRDAMSAAAGGTSNSHRRVSPAYILAFKFKKPYRNLLEKFEGTIWNSLLLIDKNRNEIRSLAQLRDLLLPRLMSGRIDI